MSEFNSTTLTAVGAGKNNRFLLYRCGYCTKIKEMCKYDVRVGKVRSCGCVGRKMTGIKNSRHGKTGTRVYSIWCNLINRATNNNGQDADRYVVRGIRVCERWRKFELFYADMGDPPDGMSIERIDNDKGYEPENCKWATQSEQMRNTRRTRKITYKGRTMCVVDWAKEIGIQDSSLRERIDAWGVERALSTPAPSKKQESK